MRDQMKLNLFLEALIGWTGRFTNSYAFKGLWGLVGYKSRGVF